MAPVCREFLLLQVSLLLGPKLDLWIWGLSLGGSFWGSRYVWQVPEEQKQQLACNERAAVDV